MASRVFLLQPPDRPLQHLIEKLAQLQHNAAPSLQQLSASRHREASESNSSNKGDSASEGDGGLGGGAKLPFELAVLEAMIELAIQGYATEVETNSGLLRKLLRELRYHITAELLNETYSLKGRVSRALHQVSGARSSLEKLQADEAAVHMMPLTALADRGMGFKVTSSEIEQVEILLDTYEIEVESLETKLSLLFKEIESSEDVLNLRLENIQKNTFLANAFFHMVLAVLGIPTCIAAWWGTNFWSGQKFNLEGPHTAPVNFTAPDFPVDRYDSDPSLGVSWIFLLNSVGLIVVCLLLCLGMTTYVRRKGLTHMSAGA